MKLHEAIIEVLLLSKQPLTCSEIADQINSLKLYVQRKGGPVNGTQVHARVNRDTYKFLFKKDESTFPMTIGLNDKKV